MQSVNPNIERLSPGQSSSLTGTKSSSSNHAKSFALNNYVSYNKPDPCQRRLPLARSSEISRSLSFADIDTYSAVMDILLDCLTERPSCDERVFCRETGWKEPEEEVEALEAREAGCSIVATDMSLRCDRVRLLETRIGTS